MNFVILAQTASTISPEEQQRVGVYVLAFIVGLLVTGIIACAKEWRRDRAEARLRAVQAKEQAARDALSKLAREMKAA